MRIDILFKNRINHTYNRTVQLIYLLNTMQKVRFYMVRKMLLSLVRKH